MKITFLLPILVSSSIALGQDTKLTGAWDMKQFDIKSGDTAIVQSDNKVTLLHRAPAETWNVVGGGTITSNQLVLSLSNHVAPTALTIDNERKLSSADTKNAQYVASRLSSLYECSNHTNPPHIAINFSEMKKLTDEHHCTGWHSVESGSMDATRVIESMTTKASSGSAP